MRHTPCVLGLTTGRILCGFGGKKSSEVGRSDELINDTTSAPSSYNYLSTLCTSMYLNSPKSVRMWGEGT